MKSKWLIGLLIVSLVLNLLLIGFGIGRFSGERIRHVRVDPTMGFTRVIKQFPDARREELRPLVRAHHQSLRPLVRSIRQSHRAVFETVSEEPLDTEQLARKLAELRSALDSSQTANHEAFVRFAAELTPQERQQWREWLQRSHRHDRRDRPGHKQP